MGASPSEQLRRGQSPLSQANAPGPTLLGLLSLLPPQYRWTLKNFYTYIAEFLPLTASLTLTRQVGIAADSDFIVTYASAIVTDTLNTTQLGFVPQLVQLQDAAAGANFFLQPAHFMNVYGDATSPGIFAIPYVMRASGTLSVQHQNLEATDRNVRIAFPGFKSYPDTDTRQRQWQA